MRTLRAALASRLDSDLAARFATRVASCVASRCASAVALLAVVALVCGVVAPARAATQVQASLSAGTVEAGAGVTLLVRVTDPSGGTGEPRITLPDGLSVLGSEQGQNFSWVNGKSSSVIEYRYALGTERPGHFTIGPINVRVGKMNFECPTMTLVVNAPSGPRPGATPSPSRGLSGAVLVVDVSPRHPYVGQLVQLSLRLVQAIELERTSANGTPATTGFWSERYGDPIEYRTTLGSRPAFAVERRVRIYPLAPGRATIGSASLLVQPPSSGDPFFGGSSPPPVELRSDSVHVDVAPLPAGAPAGFENAVGSLHWSWSFDRGHTTQDEAVTLHLDVRGAGNLPLLRTPAISSGDFEVFTGTVDDSFAPPGEVAPGRRRFQWTLSPKRTGTLHLDPPAIAWFDPASGQYRAAALPRLEVEVLPSGPGRANDDDIAGLPGALATDLPHPGRRAPMPWVFAIGGLLLGVAIQLWRRASAPDPHAAEREKRRLLRERIAATRGTDFWHVADEAVDFAERSGEQVLRLREDIAAARYGGQTLPEADVRRRLLERLDSTVLPVTSATPMRSLAVALAAVALASWFVGSGAAGPDALTARVRAADQRARDRDVASAASEWGSVWREAPGEPALAARLAWAELRDSHVPEAAAWVLRGRTGEPRSGALAWAETRVREGGGLVGTPGAGLPVRMLEWAALAFALALGAALEWPRRRSSGALLALALAAAAAGPLQRWMASRADLAVVRVETSLVGGDTTLEPGEVVRVLARRGETMHVAAGRDVAGDVPATALLPVRGSTR